MGKWRVPLRVDTYYWNVEDVSVAESSTATVCVRAFLYVFLLRLTSTPKFLSSSREGHVLAWYARKFWTGGRCPAIVRKKTMDSLPCQQECVLAAMFIIIMCGTARLLINNEHYRLFRRPFDKRPVDSSGVHSSFGPYAISYGPRKGALNWVFAQTSSLSNELCTFKSSADTTLSWFENFLSFERLTHILRSIIRARTYAPSPQ